MTKKIFISMPLRGVPSQVVAERRQRILDLVAKRYRGRWELVPLISRASLATMSRVECVGESVKRMAGADLVVFADGWGSAPGCLVEREVAVQYQLPRIYEKELARIVKDKEARAKYV